VRRGKATTMMGSKERHFALPLQISLEDLVPADHFYRHLERTLNLSFVRAFVNETYAHSGRPSIDPIVFFKLQLVMFFEGIVRCANRIPKEEQSNFALASTLPTVLQLLTELDMK
jgi:transposase